MKGFGTVVLLAAASSVLGAPLSPGDAILDFETRVADYLDATPEDLADKDRTADRKALMKALAAIDKVEAKPSDVAILKVVQKQAKALGKEIPNGEMTSLLETVAFNAYEATGGLVQAFRDEVESLPSSAAGDALLLKIEPLEAVLDGAPLLPTRDDLLKALVKVGKSLGGLRKKLGKVLKGLDGTSIVTASINGGTFSDTSVFGAFVASGGNVVSVTFAASIMNGTDTESFQFAISTEDTEGYVGPGDYALDAEIPVATAVYSRVDAENSPVLTIPGQVGVITVTAIDLSKGAVRGTFYFTGPGGEVTGGTFFLTGLPVLPASL